MHWGPSMWNFLNTLARVYPENPTAEQIEHHKRFLETLRNVLPCPKCRNHYKQNIEKLPIDEALQSREHFIKWVIDLHNNVNISKGMSPMPYEQARSIVEGHTISQKSCYILYLSFGILVLYLLLQILKKKKK